MAPEYGEQKYILNVIRYSTEVWKPFSTLIVGVYGEMGWIPRIPPHYIHHATEVTRICRRFHGR